MAHNEKHANIAEVATNATNGIFGFTSTARPTNWPNEQPCKNPYTPINPTRC